MRQRRAQHLQAVVELTVAGEPHEDLTGLWRLVDADGRGQQALVGVSKRRQQPRAERRPVSPQGAEAALLDVGPPPAAIWARLERKLRREGVIQ